MNPTLSLVTLLAAVCLAGAMSPQYKQKVMSPIMECMKKYNFEKEEVIKVMETFVLPEDKEKQCFAGCIINGMGYVKDLTMDWGMVKADNTEKFDTAQDAEKANQVVDACSKTVNEKAANLCELGLKVVKCLKEQVKEVGLEMPKISFE